jgi:hypothetical protein
MFLETSAKSTNVSLYRLEAIEPLCPRLESQENRSRCRRIAIKDASFFILASQVVRRTILASRGGLGVYGLTAQRGYDVEHKRSGNFH